MARVLKPSCMLLAGLLFCGLAVIRMRTEDDADDEVLSVAVVKNGRKLVAGTQSGVLNIYTWGAMRDCSDR